MSGSDSITSIQFVPAQPADLIQLEEIRRRAFRPVFDSFRNILGDTIYEYAQLPEDLAQQDLLKALFDSDSVWRTYKLVSSEAIVGFIAIRFDAAAKVGEIGLNAVDPAHSKQGIGTYMYNFAVAEMKAAGMKVATVATGGDPAHLPARKAYRKAGFNVEIPSVWMCRELD